MTNYLCSYHYSVKCYKKRVKNHEFLPQNGKT